MANGLSMKVLLQLQKEQFDKGIASVKNSISGLGKTIKGVAGMIMGGMGLGYLVSQFKNTATQLSVVKATMENVSNGFKEYSENMEFIRRIANEYGQDMMALSNGFAKFHAAAKLTNLGLEQEKVIFEALTRAAGAFHLSADQTSNVMLAVEQMMSKGKVTAEELRRQLGNALPGAFNMMAQAYAYSQGKIEANTAALEAAMKAGKVMTVDVLPHFAQVLNATTQAANFDSLQSSLNRFKNSWVDFVDNSGFEKVFKGLVDVGTKSLSNLSEKSLSFGRLVGTVLGGVIGYKLPQAFTKLKEAGEKNLSPMTAYIKRVYGELETTKAEIRNVEEQFHQLNNVSKETHTAIIGKDDIKYIQNLSKEQEKLLKTVTRRGHQVAQEMDKQDALIMLTKKRNDLEAQRVKLYGQLDAIESTTIGNAKKLNLVWEGTKATLKAVGSAIMGIGVSMAAAFAVSLITNWIMKLVEAGKEAKRFKNLMEDSTKQIEEATIETRKQVNHAEELYKIAQDINNSDEARNRAAKELQRLLGDQKITIDEIKTGAENVTKKLNDWSTSLMNAARSAAIFSKIEQLEAEKIDLELKRNEIQNRPGYEEYASHARSNSAGIVTPVGAMTKEAKQVADYNEKIKALDTTIDGLIETAKKEGLFNPFADISDDANAAKYIKSILDGYKESMGDLNKKLKDGSVSTKKYNRDVNKLREETMKSIEKYEGWEDVVESLGKEYEKLVDSIKQTSNLSGKKTPLQELKEDLDKFIDDRNKLDNTLKAGKMTGEEYADAMKNLVNRMKDEIFGYADLAQMLEKLGQKYKDAVSDINQAISDIKLYDEIEEQIKAQDKLFEKTLEKSSQDLARYYDKVNEIIADGIPERKKKEVGIFAYKDGLDTTLNGMARDAESEVRELEKIRDRIIDAKKLGPLDPYMEQFFDKLIEKLRIATNEATALRDAANYAEAARDIKELKESLLSTKWDAWSQGIVGGISNINSALQTLNEVADGGLFDEEFLEQVEKVMSVFEALNSIVETINNTFKIFNAIVEMTTKLQEAQAAQASVLSGVKTGALSAEAVAEKASAAATISSEAAKSAAVQATTKELAKQGIAGAAASQANVPIVGPALAMVAAAGLATLLLSQMGRFAKGGIVGGNSFNGDKQVARVNSGEMILNKAQQSTLWNILNGKGGLGGQVEFKIRGADLIGTINNYNSRMRG